MPYIAALTRRFLRELRKQPDNIKERTLRAIDEIIANPFLGVKLRGELEGHWRWRMAPITPNTRINYIYECKILSDISQSP